MLPCHASASARWWKEEETSGWLMSMRRGGEGRGRRGEEARQGGLVLRLQVDAIASSGAVRVCVDDGSVVESDREGGRRINQ